MSGEAKRKVVWAVAEQQVKMGVSLVQARQRQSCQMGKKRAEGQADTGDERDWPAA